MKKILLMLTAICLASFIQAASCAWGSEWAYDLNENDLNGQYFIIELTTNNTAGISVNKSGALVDKNGYIATTKATGTFTGDAVGGEVTGLSELNNGTYWALVIVDDANTYYGISNIETIAGISDDPTAPKDADALLFTNYFSSWGENAMMADTPTTVPEPTALALLALGVAGLALRRKNA